jgi:hypothetical protein
LIGQYLEICVCPWEPARTFCCHFRRLFHWLIGPKLICVNDFVFSIFFVVSPCLRTLITCVFSESDVWWWCGCGLGVVLGSTGSCLWCDLVVGVLMSWVHVFSVISVVLVSVFVWCSEFEGCSWFVFLSYCGVSSGVRVGHGLLCCVRVVICFCRLCHCCLSFPCLPHLGEPFLLLTLFLF